MSNSCRARHLYLSAGGRAFARAPCEALVPLRLDFALQRALCPWCLLADWTTENAHAVAEAVEHAQTRLRALDAT